MTQRAEVGPNNGLKLQIKQKLYLNKSRKISFKHLNYQNSKIEFIRILKGTNFDYFPEDTINNFLSKSFTVSK